MPNKNSQYTLKCRAKNPQRYNAYMRSYNAKYPEKKKTITKSWSESNWNKLLLSNARRSAKNRSLEINIGLEDIVIPAICPYLQIPLTGIHGQGIVDSNASIDRIDNSKGYIKGNIQIISHLANQMKSCASNA